MRSLLVLMLLLRSNFADAHVKWFSGFSYRQPPAEFAQLNHSAFWFLLTLSLIAIGFFVYENRVLEKWPAYVKLNAKLESYSKNAAGILRIFTGASLLLAWETDSMIAPELKISSQAWGYFQFALALCMLGATTSAIAGAGMILLYEIGRAHV